MTGQLTDAERLTQDFASNVLQAIGFLAPERAGELNEIIAKLQLDTMVFERGGANFSARVKGVEIQVTYAALLSLWAVARAAVIFGHAGMTATREGRTTLDADPGTPLHEGLRLVAVARSLIRDPAATWPVDLPVPVLEAPEGTVDYLASNIFLAAAGWINLHEIAHFKLGHELDTTDTLLRQQEYDADEWATEWVLAACPLDQFDFRMFTIAVAFTWIGLIDDVRRGSTDHPHAWDRFERCARKFDGGQDGLNPGLELSTQVIKTVFIPSAGLGVSETPESAFFDTLQAVSRLPR